MSTLAALEVTDSKSPNRESILGERQRARMKKERKKSKDTPHVFLILPNLAKMCSLVVLLTNKQAIYCTVKCFILTPYSF